MPLRLQLLKAIPQVLARLQASPKSCVAENRRRPEQERSSIPVIMVRLSRPHNRMLK